MIRIIISQSLNRSVVKSDTAYVKVPELNFEVPPNTQKGVVTTVEGVLLKSIEDLLKEQPRRKVSLKVHCVHHLFVIPEYIGH